MPPFNRMASPHRCRYVACTPLLVRLAAFSVVHFQCAFFGALFSFSAIQRTYLSSPPPSPSNVDSFHSGGGGGCMTVAAATVAATAAAAPTE